MTASKESGSPERWSPPLHVTLIIVLWTSLVLVFALGLYLTGLNSPFPVSIGEALYQAFRDWLPWILVSPLILWLANRYRLERNSWRSSVAIHLTAALLLTLAYQALLYHTRMASPTMFISRLGIGGRTEGPVIEGTRSGSTHITRIKTFDAPPPDQLLIAPPPGVPVGQGAFTLAVSENLEEDHWRHFFHLAFIRSQFTLPLYWVMVIACWAANYYRESRERERRALELEASLTRANLQALKMQLQPHFLFNTLNAISALVHQNPDAADEMLGSLSDLLRMSLEFSDQHEVTLRQELEFLECYLSIQQTRFGSRLRIRKDIDASTLDARVPTFVLQPFVENAVQHGIEPRKSGGTITLRSWRSDSSLHLEISDDGQGLAAPSVTSLKEGIGLSNSKARLRELYGPHHHFSLKRNASGGVCVALELPFKSEEAPAPASPATIATA